MVEQLKQKIIRKCRAMGVPMVGFASVDRWEHPPFQQWIPEDFRPKSIFPEAKTVIVLGMPVTLPVVETAPSIAYHQLYKTVNELLDQSTYLLSNYLNGMRHGSMFVPRDGYGHLSLLKDRPIVFFSHRHAAYLAGLGTFGVNNVLLTREYGPRVRFGSVFTAAEVDPDPIMEGDLCIRCMRCVEICPVRAIPGQGYPVGLTDKKACTLRNLELLERHEAPCGLCIKVCPVGEDRELFGRTDMAIYDEGETDYKALHRAWKHVQSYGSGKRSRPP
ncbi:MAG: 4Fe-4S binding protein [Candidatus Methanosuratincola sp.]